MRATLGRHSVKKCLPTTDLCSTAVNITKLWNNKTATLKSLTFEGRIIFRTLLHTPVVSNRHPCLYILTLVKTLTFRGFWIFLHKNIAITSLLLYNWVANTTIKWTVQKETIAMNSIIHYLLVQNQYLLPRFLNELIFCEFRHKPVGAPPCGRPSIRANVINLYGYSYISMNILRAATQGRPYKYMFCS